MIDKIIGLLILSNLIVTIIVCNQDKRIKEIEQEQIRVNALLNSQNAQDRLMCKILQDILNEYSNQKDAVNKMTTMITEISNDLVAAMEAEHENK